MRCGTYVRCLALGLIPTLAWSSRVCAQSSQDEGCVVRGPSDPQSAAIVIDSLEFQDDAGLTPEMRGRLVDELTHRTFNVSSAEDAGWQNELRDEIRIPLQEQGYFKAVVDFTSGLIRAEPHRLHYWVSVRSESGSQYHLGEVRFENAAGFTEKVLRQTLPMLQGDLYSVPKVREGLDNLRRLYGRLGYIDSTAEPGTTIDEDARRIDLTLKLEVGAQYRVGALAIHGFDSEAEKFLKSKFEVGQVFDATAVHEFFRANRAVWLSGTRAENGLTLARDASSGTVGLVFEHRVCPWP
jgi:outer membrane translocation and assembly module TamA